MRLTVTLALAVLGITANCPLCSASEDSTQGSPVILSGIVYEKETGSPLPGALVVVAEPTMQGNSDPYNDLTSVLTDSKGRFVVSCVWENKKHLALLVWKHGYFWNETPEHTIAFFQDRKHDIEVYLGKSPPGPPLTPANVFYATDREQGSSPHLSFLNARDPLQQLHYGLCHAGIEGPVQGDPIAIDKGVALQLESYPSSKDFLEAISKNNSDDMFIFIHGFDNSFDDACATAAQLTYNLRFRGTVLIYSWPSNDDLSAYSDDEEAVSWSGPHLKLFLEMFASSVKAHVYILAHSMGNRALLSAMSDAADFQVRQWSLEDLVFAAPDVDSDTFKRELTHGIVQNRATLYASKHDLALCVSKKIHSDRKRAGDSTPEIDTAAKLDSIDASLVDTSMRGHSYYSTSWSVLADLHALIQDKKIPSQRFGLVQRKTERDKKIYWAITPPE
jgi:esterase/lipase superfamily enzyme